MYWDALYWERGKVPIYRVFGHIRYTTLEYVYPILENFALKTAISVHIVRP